MGGDGRSGDTYLEVVVLIGIVVTLEISTALDTCSENILGEILIRQLGLKNKAEASHTSW